MSSYPGYRGKTPLNESMSMSGSAKYGSEDTTLYSYPRNSVVDQSAIGKYKEIEISAPKLEEDVSGKEPKVEEEPHNQHGDGDIYPSPLGLFLLVTGIALSVFLISLDRTIITTVRDFLALQKCGIRLLIPTRPFHSLRMSSTPTPMLAGMDLPTSSQHPLSSLCTAASTLFSI
jgi:hypothetical protein